MKELRRCWLHVVLLAVAAVFAYVQARPKDASSEPLQPGEVELWRGKPDDVTKVVVEDDRQVVTLERRSDAHGAWYAGLVEPKPAAPDASAPDAGPKKPKPRPVERASFMSVEVAGKLVERLAPLRAKRAIGVIGADRAEEFGFHKPEGTLKVTVAGSEHVLLVGGTAAGSGDRYAREVQTEQVYVIDGAPVRDLKAGEARLIERSQHRWKVTDIDKATVSGGGQSRTVMRAGTEGRRFWADASTPDKNDETSGNWLGKLERLRPSRFLDQLPEGSAKIVRVEYHAEGKTLGFLELYTNPGDDSSPYAIMTEQLRMPATVLRSVAEQVAEDLASVLPGATLPPLPAKKSTEHEGHDHHGDEGHGPGMGPVAPPTPPSGGR